MSRLSIILPGTKLSHLFWDGGSKINCAKKNSILPGDNNKAITCHMDKLMEEDATVRMLCKVSTFSHVFFRSLGCTNDYTSRLRFLFRGHK